MKASLRNSAPTTHCRSWHDLARRLARHSSWLHQSAPQTKASSTKIERWCKQLATFPNIRTTERAQRGGQR